VLYGRVVQIAADKLRSHCSIEVPVPASFDFNDDGQSVDWAALTVGGERLDADVRLLTTAILHFPIDYDAFIPKLAF
jgi:hypothetical protein